MVFLCPAINQSFSFILRSESIAAGKSFTINFSPNAPRTVFFMNGNDYLTFDAWYLGQTYLYINQIMRYPETSSSLPPTLTSLGEKGFLTRKNNIRGKRRSQTWDKSSWKLNLFTRHDRSKSVNWHHLI